MEEIDKTNLTDQTKYRLNKITMIKHYFIKEINQEKSCIKIDYIDKILIVLSAACGGVSFTFFTSIVGAPVGTANASYTLIFL